MEVLVELVFLMASPTSLTPPLAVEASFATDTTSETATVATAKNSRPRKTYTLLALRELMHTVHCFRIAATGRQVGRG